MSAYYPMRIRIDSDPIGPLKVLHDLPDAPLAVLEGLNGIGKTLAVHLLELCVGTRPYRVDAPAWRSLCSGLGPFSVSISGLRDGSVIRWTGDSRDWLEELDVPPGVSFREITINGLAASPEDVRHILAVHRIAGNEGIVETLAQQADSAMEQVRRWAQGHADPKAGPLSRLEGALGEALRLLGPWTTENYRELTSASQDARAQISQASHAFEHLQARRDDIATAVDLQTRLSEIRQLTPDLSARLQEVESELDNVEVTREKLLRKVQTLAGQVAAAQPLLKELTNARRTLGRNREYLSYELNRAAVSASRLHVRPHVVQVNDLVEQLEQEVARLNEERVALDIAPTMRGLLDQLAGELVQAEALGLGNQIAVEDPSIEVQLTVTQTRMGMAARRLYWEGKPPPPQAREVIEQLEHVTESLHRALGLKDLLAVVARYERLVSENEERVNRALAQINPHATAQMQDLEAQRRESDDRLLQLAAERAALRQQLGASGDDTSERAIGLRLAELLRTIGIAEDDLPEARVESESALHQAQTHLLVAQDRMARLRRELLQAEADIGRAARAAVDDERLAWLRAGIPEPLLSIEGTTPQQQLALIQTAQRLVQALSERLGDFRTQLAAIESALRGTGRRLRGLDPQTREYLGELESWFGRRFSAWFNDTRVRHELLPGAESDIVVDVGAREVFWQEQGTKQSRPLEAFSSGEQAFAYTRARLAVLDEEEVRPANRLVVLDEFGAFIAHDRLARLLVYLQERATEHPEDQVLIILPLSRDYAELAQSTTGEESARFASLAEEIARRQYAVQVL